MFSGGGEAMLAEEHEPQRVILGDVDKDGMNRDHIRGAARAH